MCCIMLGCIFYYIVNVKTNKLCYQSRVQYMPCLGGSRVLLYFLRAIRVKIYARNHMYLHIDPECIVIIFLVKTCRIKEL